MSEPVRLVATDEHITTTVAKLEEVLADAKAGKLSSVVIVGDLRGSDEYQIYSSWTDGRLRLVGKLFQVMHDICAKESQ